LFRSPPEATGTAPRRAALPVSEGSAGTSCRIVALGDSLTAGYELDPSKAYPAALEKRLRENGYPCTVVNGGISGDTSKALLDRLDFTLGNERYDLALLVVGGNDGLQTLPVEDLRKNIGIILDRLESKKIPVVFAGMQIPNNAGSYAQAFKAIYPEIAAERGPPYYPFFLEGVAMDPKYNLSDGIHPNPEGYSIIAGNLYEFLKKEKLLEKLPKNSQ
jgi:acyl-CoA thioesterase-1